MTTNIFLGVIEHQNQINNFKKMMCEKIEKIELKSGVICVWEDISIHDTYLENCGQISNFELKIFFNLF